MATSTSSGRCTSASDGARSLIVLSANIIMYVYIRLYDGTTEFQKAWPCEATVPTRRYRYGRPGTARYASARARV